MTLFIDSDILFQILRGHDLDVVARWQDLAAAETPMLCSPVSVAEIWTAAHSDEHVQIERLFRPLLCTSIDCETGKQAGEYLRKYSRTHDLKTADALVAAAAVRHHAALWTRDRQRYPMHDLSFYD